MTASIAAAAVAVSAQAQGSIKGVVFDPTNRLLPEATLVLTRPDDAAFRREHVTDRTAGFEFADLTPGRYALEISRPAFRTFRVDVDVTGPIEQNLRMTIGALRETLTIVGRGGVAPVSPFPRQAPSGPAPNRDDQVEAMCGRGKPGRVGGLVIPPQRTRHVTPVYAESLVLARLGGTVAITGVITPQGTVEQLRQVGEAPAALVQALADAVAGWRYTPVLLNCEPIAVELNVEGRFVP